MSENLTGPNAIWAQKRAQTIILELIPKLRKKAAERSQMR
jgi:hypothetical protein